jgi:hypothetical protein
LLLTIDKNAHVRMKFEGRISRGQGRTNKWVHGGTGEQTAFFKEFQVGVKMKSPAETLPQRSAIVPLQPL